MVEDVSDLRKHFSEFSLPTTPPATDYYLLDELLTPQERDVRDRVRGWVDREVIPNAAVLWDRAEFPAEIIPKFKNIGIVGGPIRGYGCPGMSLIAAGLVAQELARGDSSIATFFGVHSGLAMGSIAILGSKEQRERWLPAMARMELIGAFALTEPIHGSDSVGLETSARKDGDSWVLRGAKKWIGNGSFADLIIVWARDEAGEVGGFVVEAGARGFEARVTEGKIALRSVLNAEITLDDVRAYYARTYRPDLATLVVVGNVRAAEVRASVERTFGAWRGPGGEPPSLELARAPLNGAGDVTIAQPSLAQDSVTLEELIDADRRSPQFAALTLGNAVLGGGSLGAEQSRLFRDIRQNAGLVYTIASQYNATRTRASFSVDFASSPNDRARIESLVDGEIARMQNEPVGDFELALAKAAIVRRSAIADASIGAIGQALLRASLDGAPFDRERADSAAILATTPAAVRDAFAKFVRRKDFVRVVVGP
ncbi:MAG: hypothetical protein NVS4B5_17620 [Vulcanimicrobiaceae bacterium]